MKARMTLIGLMFLSLLVSAQVSDTQAVFEEANAAYKAGEFEKAIDLYESLTEEGQSTALYFNLGNAYFKTNAVARAILNYERALQLSPADPDVQYNLKLANDRIKDKIEKLPELNITRWWKTFTLSLGVDAWAWISIGLMTLSMILILVFLLSQVRGLRAFSFYTALVLLLACGFTYFEASRAQEIVESQTEAIIMSPRVDVKGAPTNSGVNVFVIHAGTKVRVLGEREGWVNIRIASGNEGWIPESDCTVI